MEVLLDVFVGGRRDGAIALERSEIRVVFGGECLSKRARPGRSRDDGVRRVRFDERVSEELTTKQVGRMDGRSGGRVGP